MEIEDQGIGVPQNEYHKIFQRFYRGSSKEVMEKSGTGIGLFLSREIIEKHAGTITVTSGKKKKGSTFVIQLPYVFRRDDEQKSFKSVRLLLSF